MPTRRGRWSVIAFVALTPIMWTSSGGATNPWTPVPGLHWQYQLQGKLRTDLCVVPTNGGSCVRPDVYDIDLYTPDGVTLNVAGVNAVHGTGAHAVCYVDAGTWENFRPDAAAYPDSVKGLGNGWPGERWLDIRATGTLLPIIDARVQRCARAGFDSVEFDNVDGYTNTTGFPLTASDQLTFNNALANMAHSRGLSVGLKNDLDQLGALQNTFDYAINEQCAQFHECGAYDAWTAAGKAVLEVEYRGHARAYCNAAGASSRDVIHKALALRATPWRPCR